MSVLKWLDKNLEIGCMAVLLIIMTALSFTNVVLCSLRPPAVANAFRNGRCAENNGRNWIIIPRCS